MSAYELQARVAPLENFQSTALAGRRDGDPIHPRHCCCMQVMRCAPMACAQHAAAPGSHAAPATNTAASLASLLPQKTLCVGLEPHAPTRCDAAMKRDTSALTSMLGWPDHKCTPTGTTASNIAINSTE